MDVTRKLGAGELTAGISQIAWFNNVHEKREAVQKKGPRSEPQPMYHEYCRDVALMGILFDPGQFPSAMFKTKVPDFGKTLRYMRIAVDYSACP